MQIELNALAAVSSAKPSNAVCLCCENCGLCTTFTRRMYCRATVCTYSSAQSSTAFERLSVIGIRPCLQSEAQIRPDRLQAAHGSLTRAKSNLLCTTSAKGLHKVVIEALAAPAASTEVSLNTGKARMVA